MFTSVKTLVFWDIDNCKIPKGLDAVDVSVNIRSSLVNMGYHGKVEITAFGDIYNTESDYFNAGIGINHCPAENDYERREKILVEFLCKAIGTAYQSNYMLILGDISEHKGFSRALRYLKSKKCYNVFLAQPEYVSSQLLDNVREVWTWSSLAVGGSCVSQRERERAKSINDEIVTASKEDEELCAKTDMAVFWDMEDCQIPKDSDNNGLNHVKVLENITTALKHKDYCGTVTFYGYKNQIDGLESTKIVSRQFLTGDKKERLDKILVDSLCWANEANDNRSPKNVMLILGDISGHNEFVLAFNMLRSKNYNCLLAQSQSPSELTFDDGFTMWHWSSLSTGGKPITQTEITQTKITEIEHIKQSRIKRWGRSLLKSLSHETSKFIVGCRLIQRSPTQTEIDPAR